MTAGEDSGASPRVCAEALRIEMASTPLAAEKDQPWNMSSARHPMDWACRTAVREKDATLSFTIPPRISRQNEHPNEGRLACA